MAVAAIREYALHPELYGPSQLLIGIQMAIITIFFIIRRESGDTSWHPWDVFIAFAGSFAPYLFIIIGEKTADQFLVSEGLKTAEIVGTPLQIAGILMTLLAVLSLNRSFGIIPANRGIMTRGAYALVRHPIYSAYQLQNLGYCIVNPQPINWVIAVVCLFAQVLRIRAEENLLMRDPEYQAYADNVRFRLLPPLW